MNICPSVVDFEKPFPVWVCLTWGESIDGIVMVYKKSTGEDKAVSLSMIRHLRDSIFHHAFSGWYVYRFVKNENKGD